MWKGWRGLVLTLLLGSSVFGLVWASWVGAPSPILGATTTEISRGRYYSRIVSAGLWWTSEVISIAMISSWFAFIFTVLAFHAGRKNTEGGRNYSRVAGVIGVCGIVLAIIGTVLAPL